MASEEQKQEEQKQSFNAENQGTPSNDGATYEENGKMMYQKKSFSILKEIKDDPNFKAFLNKFYDLKRKCQ